MAGDGNLARVEIGNEADRFDVLGVEERIDHTVDVVGSVECSDRAGRLAVGQAVDSGVPDVVGCGDDVAVTGKCFGVVRVDEAKAAGTVGVDHQRERTIGRDALGCGSDCRRRFVVRAGEQGVLLWREVGVDVL